MFSSATIRASLIQLCVCTDQSAHRVGYLGAGTNTGTVLSVSIFDHLGETRMFSWEFFWLITWKKKGMALKEKFGFGPPDFETLRSDQNINLIKKILYISTPKTAVNKCNYKKNCCFYWTKKINRQSNSPLWLKLRKKKIIINIIMNLPCTATLQKLCAPEGGPADPLN